MKMNRIIREKRKNLGMTQEQVAKRVGKSRPAIANALGWPPKIKSLLDIMRKKPMLCRHWKGCPGFLSQIGSI